MRALVLKDGKSQVVTDFALPKRGGDEVRVLARGDYWAEAPSAVLSPGGASVVLGGASYPVRAVRLNWRAYPCEHLGCGVYSRAEGLPPPPFWAAVP